MILGDVTRRPAARWVIALLTLICLTLSACDGDDDESQADGGNTSGQDGATAKNVDACNLLTEQELQTASGESVADSKLEPAPGGVRCSWELGGKASKGLINLRVYTTKAAPSLYDASKRLGQPVEGVGDDAFWHPDGRSFNVLTGKSYFRIEFRLASELKNEKSVGEELAGSVLGRL